MSVSNTRIKVHELCLNTLEGKVSRKVLIAQWPPEANESSFLKLVYADLMDGIRHYPRYWFKKGVDVDKWREQLEYNPILLDSTLLVLDKPDEILLKSRVDIFNEDHPDIKLEKLKKRRQTFKKRMLQGLVLGVFLIAFFVYWLNCGAAKMIAENNVFNGVPFYKFYEMYSRWPKDMNEIQKFIYDNKSQIPVDFTDYTYQSFEVTPQKSIKIYLLPANQQSKSQGEFSCSVELTPPKIIKRK